MCVCGGGGGGGEGDMYAGTEGCLGVNVRGRRDLMKGSQAGG